MTTMLLNNRYQVIQVLGAGGFGETFLAEDTYMPSRHRCAIKQLKTTVQNPQTYQLIKKRFEREAVTLELLGKGSDQIPKLYAYFSERGQFYIVQEFIHGQTLTDIIKATGYLDETAVTPVIVSLLSVLDYVHSKGIIHRDIKPDNIIIRSADGKPVLIDFGAVKETIRLAANTPGQPTTSLIIGTPGYMPNEQVAGRPIYATDIYSLGLTAIYLLTGKSPQELQNNQQTGEILWQHHAPNISPYLATILSQAIKPNASERFSTASKMLHALHLSCCNSTSILPTAVSTQPTQALPTPAKSSVINGQQKSALIALTVAIIMLPMGYNMVNVGLLGQRSPKMPVVKNSTPTPLPLVTRKPADRLIASQHTPVPVSSNLPTLKIPKSPDLKASKFPKITEPADVTSSLLTPQHSPVVLINFPNTPKQTTKQPLIIPYNFKPITSPKVSGGFSEKLEQKMPKVLDSSSRLRSSRLRSLQQEMKSLQAKYRSYQSDSQNPETSVSIPMSQLDRIDRTSVPIPVSQPESLLIERLRGSRKTSDTQTSH